MMVRSGRDMASESKQGQRERWSSTVPCPQGCDGTCLDRPLQEGSWDSIGANWTLPMVELGDKRLITVFLVTHC